MGSVNYFLWNKKEDYLLRNECVCSAVMDSGEREQCFSRLKLLESGQPIKLWLFTSEQDYLVWRGIKYNIAELLRDRERPFEEIWNMIAPYKAAYLEQAEDCLLTDVKGRYLWFVTDKTDEKLPAVQIFIQSTPWTEFLPEIYRNQEEDSFLYRYLSIFQWIYYDMSQKIESLPHRLYPAFADMERLEWMADWIGLEHTMIWNREQLIFLLENGDRLFEIRGTKKYLTEMVRLYTGFEPYVVEYHQTEKYKTDIRKTQILEELYGENAYVVTVVLPEAAVTDYREHTILYRIIASAVPVYMECRLVILEPYIFLNRHCYMGINSSLGSHRDIRLDGNGLVPYVSMVGSRKEGGSIG